MNMRCRRTMLGDAGRFRPSYWLLPFALLACEPRTEIVEDTAAPIQATAREERVRRAIMIEGMADTLEFRLVRAPRDFPLPFSTYVPDDMDAEFTERDGRHVVHFTARFAGRVEPRARLSVHAYPPGTPVEQAQSELAAYLSGLFPDDSPIRGPEYERATPIEPASGYAWAANETRFEVPRADAPGTLTGRSGVGMHGDRAFHFVIEYPPEYGDGMGPRVDAILDEWRWEDTGRMLSETPAPATR
jgi:hypothetical protein